jgi:ABC-type polysaccharide/polyol phosphate transport system ATPase subunit
VADVALRVGRVSKKFRKGELHDSLRDLVPALARRLSRRSRPADLGAREFWALRDVDFEVAQGEAFGVIGPNGAGKSTLLKILSGILRPTEGEIAVRGRLSALIEVGAGFHPDLTGRENIFLSGAILGLSRAEVRGRFDEIVAFAGLEEFIDTPVKRYSSGMYARLGFAVAAHVDPDVLLVDEILSVGDLTFQRRCLERMQTVIDRGATVLFVSHNLRLVAELCQRTALLERGRLRAVGPSDDVVRAYTDTIRELRRHDREAAVTIESATPRTAGGDVRTSYRSGEDLALDVVVGARAPAEHMGLGLTVRHARYGVVFTTSSRRLGVPTLRLDAGEAVTFRIDLTLNLAPATYTIDLHLNRYDVEREVDHWPAAVTFVVSSDADIRGIADLRPRFRCTPGAGDPPRASAPPPGPG